MAGSRTKNGFTLIELVAVIALVGVIAVVAAPRFLSVSSDANQAVFEGVFDNFLTGVQIYQGACLARGGDVEDPRGGPYTQDTDVEGISSNYTGTCYPVSNTKDDSVRTINRTQACVDLVNKLMMTDYFEGVTYQYPPIPANGGSNARNITEADLENAREAGYRVFIHQRTYWGVSFCHFYQIDGNLSDAAYFLYNAVDGQTVSGIQDISQGFTWPGQRALYP